MTQRIAMRYTVALEGFSDADRPGLVRFFGLSTGRAPLYAEAAAFRDADFVIANADHSETIVALREAGRLHDTVFVGSQAPRGAVACLAHPVSPASLIHQLDGLLGQRLESFDEPVGAERSATAPGLPGMAEAEASSARDVLVVDDSRIALKFLQVRLEGLGYQVHLAQTAAEALRLLASQPFSMVFLDVVLGPEDDMDGLALCQHIKQRGSHPGGVVPRVVMVTGLGNSRDRVLGDLAGCDAYLTKPLMAPVFLETLQMLDRSLVPA